MEGQGRPMGPSHLGGNVRTWCCLLALIAGAGCGDDDASGTDAGPGVDSGRMDSGGPPDDGGGVDSGPEVDSGPRPDGGPQPDAGVETVTVTGTIYGEDVGSGTPPLEAVRVSIVLVDGTEFDSTTTAADGTYTLTAPRGTTTLHRSEPIEGYLGNVRGELGRGMDYEAYDVNLLTRAGVEAAVADTGATYDETLGYVVVGFNPVDVMAGGQGATLTGVTHDPAFILYPGGFEVTNVLPRICGAGETPGADDCAATGRNNQVFFPNVDGASFQATLIEATGEDCTERFGITDWPVYPDTSTGLNVDCMAE